MDCRGSIEEEKLGFVQIKGCARGFTEVCKDGFEPVGLLSIGSIHEHGIIHELAMGGNRLQSVEREPLKGAIQNRGC
jgi:hypothetical protein